MCEVHIGYRCGSAHKLYDCRCHNCKTWAVNRKRTYNDRNRERVRELDRRSYLKRRFNLTAEEYDDMVAKAGGVCEMCGQAPDAGQSRYKNLSVDHDHSCCPAKAISCGKCVRGLLCAPCNSLLGFARDNAETLRAGAEYLERHNIRNTQ